MIHVLKFFLRSITQGNNYFAATATPAVSPQSLSSSSPLFVPEANALEPTVTVKLPGGAALAMVYVPGGRFWMGSPEHELERLKWEGPQHQVTVPPFYMGKYPVTQRQWRTVSQLDPVDRFLAPAPSLFKSNDLPVERVNWYEAVEFCRRLSQHTGQDYRLPSEAEWEYACRAGTDTPFFFGATLSTDQANYNGYYIYGAAKKGLYRGKPMPVGSFPANGLGLHDLHGNVWEWCADYWHKNYEGAPEDGRAWLSSDKNKSRVVRGGSWYAHPADCRSASRDRNYPGNTPYNNSFRVVCSVPCR